MDESNESLPVSAETTDAAGQLDQLPEAKSDRLQLMTRIVIGLLASGSGNVMQRLDELEAEVLADPELRSQATSAQVETPRDALKYMAIGLLLRGERQAVKGIRGGLDLTADAVRLVFRSFDRVANNRVMRPVRGPIDSRMRNWGQEASDIIEEGKREEIYSRVLAGESIGLIIDDVVDFVAENPDIDRIVAELLSQKSVGLASVVMDNTRSLSATADDVTEGALRRLLRRTPRQKLPPSPIEGKPQTMYRRLSGIEGGDTDVE